MVGILAMLGALLITGGCSTATSAESVNTPTSTSTTVTETTATTLPPTTLTETTTTVAPAATIEVEAFDYEFRGLPSQLSIGDALELVNRSPVEYHNLVVVALSPDDTRSIEDFAVMSPDELEAEVRWIDHLDAAPGKAAFNGTIRLQVAGRYLALDMVPEGADPAIVERLVNPPSDTFDSESPPWIADGGCQWPLVSPRGRSWVFPACGHGFSPRAATVFPAVLGG
jgi:hypothetical protein